MARPGPAAQAGQHGRTAHADWAQVREMPHCAIWRASDWTFALETAFMKQAYWQLADEGEATTTMAVEIRRREDQMGTTIEALRKLRIRYTPVGEVDGLVDEDEPAIEVVEVAQAATPGGGATVTPLANRRARLTQSA
jgi:hypothetical protein